MARQPARPPNGVQFSHRLLKTSVQNPFDTFTAPQFDNWVDDITSTIRNALSGKARGKARDPREGAGLDGLRRLFAQPGDTVDLDESLAADETDDQATEDERPQPRQESTDLTQDDAQQEEEMGFFSEDDEREPRVRDAEAERYYGHDSPAAADDEDQQETLDFDSIYANGATLSETPASPAWSIEAEGNTILRQDAREYDEDYNEGDEYPNGEDYADDGEYAEGVYYGDENEDGYYDEEAEHTARSASHLSQTAAAPEVFEIDDDDDVSELPTAQTGHAAPAGEEDEEDELDDEDKENAVPARSPSIARSAPYAYSPSYSRRTPLSSVRDVSSGASPQPQPQPQPRPAEPEVFTISDDEDEADPTLAAPLHFPAAAPATPAPVQEAVAFDQAIDELDLDSLQQLPTQAAPPSQEDSAMDLFDLADLQTRADEPSATGYLVSDSADLMALDKDVVEFMSQATSGVLPLGMDAIDPAILAVELAAFDAGIDAALEAQAQASAAQTSDIAAYNAGIDAALEAQALASTARDQTSALAAFNAGLDAALEAQTPAPVAPAHIVPVELSEIEKAATSDIASLTATAPLQGNVEGEDGPLQANSPGVVEDIQQSATSAPEHEAAVSSEAVASTPPATPSHLHIPTTPSRERGSPLFMSPGELPVVQGEFLNEEPEKMSHPPSPRLRGSSPALPDAHVMPHFLDREDIEKDGPKEDTATVADADVEKTHHDPEVPKEDTVELDISPADAAALSLDEKKALLQRDDVDPFSLMGDESLVAPGAVETPDEDEDVAQPADDEADVAPEVPDAALGQEDANDEANLKPEDVDADASGESDDEERIQEISAPPTGVSTPLPSAANLAVKADANGHVEAEDAGDVLTVEESDAVDNAERNAGSPPARPEPPTATADVVSEPGAVEARDSSPSVADILPAAMEDVLALPSPAQSTSVTSPTADAEVDIAGEASSSKGRRKSRRGRPLVPTRSSTRITRTQSSQQVPMSAPKARTRPSNSSGASASASTSSSVTGSAYSRESSVVSTRGRRSKRDSESAHGSRESTVQPTARKSKGKGKGKAKAKQEAEEELQALAKEEEPSAPSSTPAQLPERPPLLRTQTYRHYHGKKNASAGATPTWASLKWNSILQPALALVRMTGASSSTADPDQAATPAPPAAVESHTSSAESVIPPADISAPNPITSNGGSELTADVSRTGAKAEPEPEQPALVEAKPVPEVVVPHLVDVAADTSAPSISLDAEQTEEDVRPTGLHLGALPSPLPSPSLPSPAIPPPPLPTPVAAPRPRGHASRPSLVIQDSFMPESGHMTRSNCRFHKISIPAAPGSSQVVQFVTPACAITNRELMEEEGIVDCGVATDIDHARTVIELEIAPDDVLHVLRRLVGLELLREGEVGFRLPDGETIESMRERVPTAANSIFYQYRKPESKSAEGSSSVPHKKRKRASSLAPSQVSTLTDLEGTDGDQDKLNTPASRTRSRRGIDRSSSPVSPVDRRKRRRVEHEDEYRPTDADHALEVEDEEEDYAELANRPKKRGRKSGAAARSSMAPSPADTTASTPLPATEDGDMSKAPEDEAAGAAVKPQKKASRRKSRKRKAGVVDPAFKAGSAPVSDSESEVEEGPARKTAKPKRGKKRAAAEEAQHEGAVERGSAKPPISKKRKVAAVGAGGGGREAENA